MKSSAFTACLVEALASELVMLTTKEIAFGQDIISLSFVDSKHLDFGQKYIGIRCHWWIGIPYPSSLGHVSEKQV